MSGITNKAIVCAKQKPVIHFPGQVSDFIIQEVNLQPVLSIPYSYSLQLSKRRKWPDPKYQLAYDLFLCHTADRFASAVHRHAAVISHHKKPTLRYLIRQFNVTFAKRFL